MTHEEVPFHNPCDHHDYEWGLEGPQLLELPDGRVLLTFVAFLSEGRRGARQRLCHALSEGLGTPFTPLDPLIAPPPPPPPPPPPNGENGHGVTLMFDGRLISVFQQKRPGKLWRPAFTHDPSLFDAIRDRAGHRQAA